LATGKMGGERIMGDAGIFNITINATVILKTGEISFTGKNGNPVLHQSKDAMIFRGNIFDRTILRNKLIVLFLQYK
jgi:hypothetical protein